MTTAVKLCPRCKVSKPVSDFGKRGADRDFAPKSYCKACERELQKIRRPPPPRPPEGYRQCTKCKTVLLEIHENFAKRSGGKFKAQCRDCERKRRRENTDPVKRRESQRQWRLKNPDKVKAKKKREYERHRDKIIQASRDWREKFPEKMKAALRNWNATHKEQRNALNRRTKAKRRQAPGTHTAEDVALQFRSQKGLCWWCGCKLDPDNYHVDHRIPLARGGTNWPNNICASCPKCNMSKNDRFSWEWNGRLL